jgi:hypothetical protein
MPGTHVKISRALQGVGWIDLLGHSFLLCCLSFVKGYLLVLSSFILD